MIGTLIEKYLKLFSKNELLYCSI